MLDIGAGQGHGLIPLAAGGWTRLIAADRDPYNLEHFERELGFQTLVCDVERDPLDLETGGADAVLCLHLIEHLQEPGNLLREVARVLRPGGNLFLVTPDWRKQYRTFYRDPTHVRPYDKVALGRLLRMHAFDVQLHSWGSAFGLGRLQAYRRFPRLGMIGRDILAVASRPAELDAARLAA